MNNILARRYARALFSLGLEDGLYQLRGEQLDNFCQALFGCGQVEVILSPVYPRDLKTKTFEAILKLAALDGLLLNFIRLLDKKGRLAILPQILVAYKLLNDEKEGLIRGTLTTASALGQGELSAVKSALGMFMGQKVELTVKVDQAIIGGLVARLGDLVIDGSVRTQLNKLGRSLVPN